MAELISTVIHLKPLELPPAQQNGGQWWGRAAHALLLRVLNEQDAELAEELHDEPELRPFTVSSLMGSFNRDGTLSSEKYYRLRVTAVRQDVTQVLETARLPGGMFAVHSRVELDYTPFEVVEAQANGRDDSPWECRSGYSELSAPYLMASQSPPRRLRLYFTSPTTFKSEGRHVPLPVPRLVFGSLLERWNAFAPVAFPPELRRYFEECLVVSRYDLKTQAVMLKKGGVRVGMTGWADFTTLNYDRYWMSLTTTLARFALFAGVGAAVTQGLGQCRLAEVQERD